MDVETTPADGSPCRHCRNPVPAGAATAPFCCHGCAAVHALLVEEGLTRYYEIAGDAATPVPVPAVGRSQSWLEPLLDPAAGAAPGELAGLRLDVQGIHCAACVWLLQETFRRRGGAGSIVINPALGQVSLTYRPDRFDPADWVRDVEAFGYRFGPARKRASSSSVDLALRLGISAALTVNVMLFSVSFYFGLAPDDEGLFRLFSWLSLALSTAVVAVGGWPFFRSSIAGLRRGVTHLDLPIAVGILLVFGTSVARMREGRGDLAYFDTLDVFITLMLLGRFLQERLIDRNRRFLLEDDGTESLSVRRVEGARLATVPAASVRSGDRLLVAPGDLVPVEGRLASAAADISTDWITGESEPRQLAAGAAIAAGSFNAGAVAFEIEAISSFADSSLTTLLATPRPRGDRPAGRRRLWDRLGRYWVAGVATCAAAGVAIWLPQGGERALEVAAALLVVTCPCAIGIAIPLAYELVLSRLRRRGCFVRDEGLLDRLVRVRKILFDKTGTLTLGSLEVARPEALRALEPAIRDAAYDLAARSSHPVARALAAGLETAGARFDPEARVRELAGRGLELERDGALWRLGRGEWAAPGRGLAGTWLARDGEPAAELPVAETLRPDVAQQVEALAGRGFEIWLLSGDEPTKVMRLARTLGLPADRALPALAPEAKAAAVARLDEQDTLFLGDGVNDSLAFERAFAAGTPAIDRPVMPGRSDFFLVGEGLSPLTALVDAARELRRVVHQLLGAALVYNVAVVAAALAGLVTPVVAAVVMPSSTLLLVARTAWRLGPRRRARAAAPAATRLAEAQP